CRLHQHAAATLRSVSSVAHKPGARSRLTWNTDPPGQLTHSPTQTATARPIQNPPQNEIDTIATLFSAADYAISARRISARRIDVKGHAPSLHPVRKAMFHAAWNH